MKSTGLNHDLADEVLRIKDALIMFPDERVKQRRYLSVNTTLPPNKPGTMMDWMAHVTFAREKHTPIPLVLPAQTDVKPEKRVLTAEHKKILKSMSYKPISNLKDSTLMAA